MHRRMAVGTAQERDLAARADDRDVHALLEDDVSRCTDPIEERSVLCATPQEDVLPVVVPGAARFERPGGTAEARPALQQRDACTTVDARERGTQPREAATDDHDMRPAHACVARAAG